MAYSLSHSYVGDAFVSDFNWFNGDDPSNGFVRYQSEPDALNQSLYSIDSSSGAVILAVDSTNTYPNDTGRPSVRLESKRAYNHGLFIGDFTHMPPSVCGLWPAFWMYGSNWPENGEVDIIQGGNTATRNLLSAHTTDGCTIPQSGIETTGEAITLDCTSSGDNNNNTGCNFVSSPQDTATYGDTFNAVGGGVYALEWTSEDIRIWHWPRQTTPRDVLDKEPAPESWGPPSALFGTSTCDPDTYFRDMSLVIQTNFCGDYAGPTWGDYDTCSGLADTCVEYVANNPEAFTNAYWEVNYIDVYERACGSGFDPELSGSVSSSSEEVTTTTTIPVTSTTTVTVYPTSSSTSAMLTEALDRFPAPSNDDDIVPARVPASIDDYAFLGCFGSESGSGFLTFEETTTSDDERMSMTPELCVETCASRERPYAGVHGEHCLCAGGLDGGTRAVADRALCDVPCPGDPSEFCGGFAVDGGDEAGDGDGGTVQAMRFQRQDEGDGENEGLNFPEGFLVSLYGVVGGEGEVPLLAPAMGGDGQAGGGFGLERFDSDREDVVVAVPCVTVGPTDFLTEVPSDGPTDGGGLLEGWVSSEPVVEPTGFVQADGASAFSLGTTIAVPLVLVVWSLMW